MKLIFDGITLGGGPRYYLDGDTEGLDANLDNIVVDIPRTDYTENIADYLQPKIWAFSGTIIGTDVIDFRIRKRLLASKLRQTFTFTLVDDYRNADGTYTTFAEYEFEGKIIEFDVNIDSYSNLSRYSLQIAAPDPNIYILPEITVTSDIIQPGFVFPLTFPFIFGSGNNSITINNTGAVNIYPTIELTGGFSNLTIVAQNTTSINNNFTFSGTVLTGDVITITPTPTDPIKIRDEDNNSLLSQTNSNFDILKLKPGSNTFSFFAGSGIDANTAVSFTYRNAYLAI